MLFIRSMAYTGITVNQVFGNFGYRTPKKGASGMREKVLKICILELRICILELRIQILLLVT